MIIVNQEGWNKAVAANTDAYGSCVIRYAERWANSMEEQMSQGKKLEDIAQETSFSADTEGITGFMYGCAVSVLTHVWIYGDQLRRWHNLGTQIQDEGVKANENGTILNPACLRLG